MSEVKESEEWTLDPIKMSVSSQTKLHTPCQTLRFSTISKEQPLLNQLTD